MLRSAFLLVPLSIALLGGCRWPADVARENVRLRHQVVELENEVEAARRERAELEATIEQMSVAADPAARGLPQARPAVVELAIGGLSHFRDTSGNLLPDTLVLYVTPRDGRGRFTQVVGEFTVQASVSEAEQAPPLVIGERRFTTPEVRDAYRSGFLGTHYTLEVQISLPSNSDPAWLRDRRAGVTVWFHDPDTGRTIEQLRVIPLLRERRERSRR
jgi:hypothetical protein